MRWKPNVGEKPDGEVLIWVGHNCWLCVYDQNDNWWYDECGNAIYCDGEVSHWMKVEAPNGLQGD